MDITKSQCQSLKSTVYLKYFKRPFDVVLASTGLILFSPILMLVSLVILLSNGLPIIFLQYRIGRNGQRFRICKFRTMAVARNQERSIFAAGQTTHVTGVGKWLRKSKLDELPQLFNVLVGQMSVVGPRPEVEQWTKVYPDKWACVHSVRPGITDWAAIEFRNEEAILTVADDPEVAYREEVLPRKLSSYLEYVSDINFKNDIKILRSTIYAVFSRS